MRNRHSGYSVLFVAVVVAAFTGCASEGRQVGETAVGADASRAAYLDTSQLQDAALPTFGLVDTAQRSVLLEHARRARFVSDHHLTDEQSILVRGERGPTVRVEAVVHAHRLSDAQLRRGALIGRLVSAGNVEARGLRRGNNYVFVDSSRGWRAIIVPEDPAQPVRVTGMAVLETRHIVHLPTARFFETGGMTYDNIKCGRLCCIPCEPMTCPAIFPHFDPMAPVTPPSLDRPGSTTRPRG